MTAASVEALDPSAAIPDLLVGRHIAAGAADRVALIDGERRWTYGELGVAVDQVAAWLLERGLDPGEPVAVLVADGLEGVAGWLGAMRAGGVAVMLNPGLPAEDYAALLARTRPRLGLIDAATESRLAPVLGALAERLVVEAAALARPRAAAPPRPPVRGGQDPAFALFTSGTTGASSCVVHRHAAVAVTGRDYGADILAIDSDDVTFSPSPLYFAYGLNSVHLALAQGGTAVLPPAVRRPGEILALLARHRPTIFFAVPTVYRMLLSHPETPALPTLRLCVSAGEHLPVQVLAGWRARYGHDVIDGIGTTETLSTFVSNRPGEPRPGSTGRPVRGFDVRLMADEHSPAAPDQAGVLWVRGATVAGGYLGDPARTAERFRDGWFVTNDVFRREADGTFTYLGRADELAKVGGVWLSPGELEHALRDHPMVEDCSVVYVDDDWGLTRPYAFVVLSPDADPAADWKVELKRHCRERGAAAAYPHFVEIVDALPRTGTGKVQRFKLRAMVADRGGTAP